MDYPLVIRRSWKAEIHNLFLFVVFSVVSVIVSKLYPWTIVTGELFSYGGTQYLLKLPLLIFGPAWPLFVALFRIHNAVYLLENTAIEAKVGILSMKQVITRLRYEDIRSIEVDQNLIERFLNIGDVSLATSSTTGVELVMGGVANPRKLQEIVQSERDNRQKAMDIQSRHRAKRIG